MTRSRNYCFTLHNPTEDEEVLIQGLDVVYLVYGREACPETQRPHLQGYVVLPHPKALLPMKKFLGIDRVHLEASKGDSMANYKYCTKDGNFYEKGVRPMTQSEKGEAGKRKYEEIFALAAEGKVEEVRSKYPQIAFHSYRTIKEIAKDNMTKPPDLDQTCGIWYYGEAGTGKTTKARTENPGAFIKSRDKWWDGYRGESVVILDDIDPNHSWMRAHLKDWADKWTFKAETKGGCLWIRPSKFIVTSQYHPNDIWMDKETRDAISRRFNIQLIIKNE